MVVEVVSAGGGCLLSQHMTQRQTCLDNCTYSYTEIEVQLKLAVSPSPVQTPGQPVLALIHWSISCKVTGTTQLGKWG